MRGYRWLLAVTGVAGITLLFFKSRDERSKQRAALENGEFHRVGATFVRSFGDDLGIRLVNFSER